MGFINPFEIVVARKPRVVLNRSVGPELPTINISGVNYEITQDRRVRLPEILIFGPSMFKFENVGIKSTPITLINPHTLRHIHVGVDYTEPDSSVADSSKVQLRQAVRACIDSGVPVESIESIVCLEYADFVMNS